MDLNVAIFSGWNGVMTETFKTHQCRLFYTVMSTISIATNFFIILVISRFEELNGKRTYVYISRISFIQLIYFVCVQIIAVFSDFLPKLPSEEYCYINFVTVLLLVVNSILIQMMSFVWMMESKFKNTLEKHKKEIVIGLDCLLCVYVMFDIAIFGINCNETNNLLEAYLLTIPVILFVNIVYKLKKIDAVESESISVLPLVLCYVYVLLWLPSFVVFIVEGYNFTHYSDTKYLVTFIGYMNGGINLGILYIFDETFRRYFRVCLVPKDVAIREALEQNSVVPV